MTLNSSYEVNASPVNQQYGESVPVATTKLDPGAWGVFCDWLTQNLEGLETTIERRDATGKIELECLSKPLDSITSRIMDNGVFAIAISVRMDCGSYKWEIAGPRSLVLYRNAAGWPTRVEIGFHEGSVVVLEFTGSRLASEMFTGNSWGE